MPADTIFSDGRERGRFSILRSLGGGAAILIGPAAGLTAWKAFGMGALEASALAFLLSGWVIPRLLTALASGLRRRARLAGTDGEAG